MAPSYRGENKRNEQTEQYLCTDRSIIQHRLKVREMKTKPPLTICVRHFFIFQYFQRNAFSTKSYEPLWDQAVQPGVSVVQFKILDFSLSYCSKNPLAGKSSKTAIEQAKKDKEE